MQLNPLNFYQNQTIVDTNVLKKNTIGNADIYCFCEAHDRPDHMEKIGNSIAEMYKKGDIVLIEGCQGHLDDNLKQKVLTLYPGIPQDAIIKGWDLEEDKSFIALDNIDSFRKKMKHLKSISFDESYKSILKEIIDLSKIDLTPKQTAYLKKSNTTQDKKIERHILVKAYDKLTAALKEIACGEGMISRNKQMAKTIKANLKENNRVFIICGEMHATAEKALSESDRFAIQVMRYAVEKFRYVILKPDDKPITKPLKEKKIEVKKEESSITNFFWNFFFVLFHPIQSFSLLCSKIASLWEKKKEPPPIASVPIPAKVIPTKAEETSWDTEKILVNAKKMAKRWGKE